MGTPPSTWGSCSTDGLFSLWTFSFLCQYEISPSANTIASCLLLVSAYEGNLLYPSIKRWNTVMWSSRAVSSPGRRDKAPSACPQGRFLSPLTTFIAFCDSSVFLHRSWSVEPRTACNSPGAAWQALRRLGWPCLCLQQCHSGCSPGFALPWLLQWCTVSQHLGRKREMFYVSTDCRMALVRYKSIQAHFHLYTVCTLAINYNTGKFQAGQIPWVNS